MAFVGQVLKMDVCGNSKRNRSASFTGIHFLNMLLKENLYEAYNVVLVYVSKIYKNVYLI